MNCKICKKEFETYPSTIKKYCSRKCYGISMIGHKNRNTGRTWIKKGSIAWNKGIKLDEVGRKKLSEAHKGKKLSEETKKKIGLKNLGRKHTEETKKKMRKNKKEIVCYVGLHQRITALLGRADHCENKDCLNKSKKYSWSNKDHKYSDNPEDWQQLCWSCHTKYDYKFNGRRNQYMIKNKLKTTDPN